MTQYISEPVAQDRPAIRGEIDAALTAQFSGVLSVPPGSLVDLLVDQFASITAEDRQLLTEVMASIFRYSGEKIDRVPQNLALQATGSSTWARTTADAALGARTVPAGTEISVTGADGSPVYFTTTADFTFDAAVTSTAAGAVALIAVIPGIDGNGLQSGAAPSQTVPWLQSVTVTAPTSGGVDAEDDDYYLNRLSDTRPLQLNAIAKSDDLARWLRNQGGVDRALVLDNYNASAGVAGHMTAWVVDANGDALTSPTMTALQAAAQSITLTNLSVHILPPVYTTVTVAFTGVARAGWDAADVGSRAESEVLAFLDRSSFGLSPTGDVRDWNDKRLVRFQDVSTVLNNVEGFDYWTALTINGGTADLTLTGPGALPKSDSTAAGTVTLP